MYLRFLKNFPIRYIYVVRFSMDLRSVTGFRFPMGLLTSAFYLYEEKRKFFRIVTLLS